jgi:hypothetical protein
MPEREKGGFVCSTMASPFTLVVSVLAYFGLCAGLSLVAYALAQPRKARARNRD